jgi:hypothetical protein
VAIKPVQRDITHGRFLWSRGPGSSSTVQAALALFAWQLKEPTCRKSSLAQFVHLAGSVTYTMARAF